MDRVDKWQLGSLVINQALCCDTTDGSPRCPMMRDTITYHMLRRSTLWYGTWVFYWAASLYENCARFQFTIQQCKGIDQMNSMEKTSTLKTHIDPSKYKTLGMWNIWVVFQRWKAGGVKYCETFEQSDVFHRSDSYFLLQPVAPSWIDFDISVQSKSLVHPAY